MTDMAKVPERTVQRSFNLPLSLFHHLKRFQQYAEITTGNKLDNSQTLALLLAEHEELRGEAIDNATYNTLLEGCEKHGRRK